jgi:hypothetical protein
MSGTAVDASEASSMPAGDIGNEFPTLGICLTHKIVSRLTHRY